MIPSPNEQLVCLIRSSSRFNNVYSKSAIRHDPEQKPIYLRVSLRTPFLDSFQSIHPSLSDLKIMRSFSNATYFCLTVILLLSCIFGSICIWDMAKLNFDRDTD